jgi:uncharacterized membrane protein YhaH (DUF805 family)
VQALEDQARTGSPSVAAQLFNSTGRASRAFFWATLVGFWLIGSVLGGIGQLLPESGKLVIGALAMPLLFVLVIVQVRRWHDLDKSGVWVFINFVPCLGAVWTLIECGFMPGTPGPNRFGPDPTAPGSTGR